MKIQTLSIVVPTAGCINQCKFCVSRMHDEQYVPLFARSDNRFTYEFSKRMQFARDNGCNTAILTGRGEPIQNEEFLTAFYAANRNLRDPFLWIELQTTGVKLDHTKLEFLKAIGVSTISLSVADVFSDTKNMEHEGVAEKYRFELTDLCGKIKAYDFNLRLSLILTKDYDQKEEKDRVVLVNFLDRADELGADQILFRKLYCSEDMDSDVDEWVLANQASTRYIGELRRNIEAEGTPLEVLPFGATKYSVAGISIVLDDDCMAKQVKDSFRYLILQPNCKLYSRWDDKASLVF